MESEGCEPYAPQDPSAVSALMKGLESGKKSYKGKRGFTCKKSSFELAGSNGITVDSWRFMDWEYKRDDLPTYARGLFTYKKRNGTPQIAIRGYDKFFNVNEVNDTRWPSVESKTRGPYELSVKENGCIIFISGIEDDHLLVCSKHSTGARKDTDVSHALAGEKWVDQQLAAIGKTRIDLAKELSRRNVTAVAELCDDTFEEHVLAYDAKSAGLYLHGMNLNLPEFTTYPGPLVHKFADAWGFKKAQFLVKDNIESTQTFLEHCAETGSYAGRDTEGFVIRCQKQEGKDGPYIDWFFKYKFEEPYLMYRQWREVTKAIIAGKQPWYRKHQRITEDYLLYARRQLANNPSLGKSYTANHGIIAMRDGFLKELGLKGSDIIRRELSGPDGPAKDVTHNLLLVPIATIGCGKTTVALALTKLFGWGHVQNDNITGKGSRPKQFTIRICNSLADQPVVIADRNNHQKRERQQLIEDVSKIIPTARFVALHYVHDPKPQRVPEIRKVTQQRVMARGDNHQTIQAGSKSPSFIAGIMQGFLDRFEPLDATSAPDDGFDEVIDLDVIESSRHNLETVVNGLRAAFPKLIPNLPSPNDLDEAIASALHEYSPDIKHDLSFRSKNADKPPKLEYFAINLPTNAITSLLAVRFRPIGQPMIRFYDQLCGLRRIQASFHITLIHRASILQHRDAWARLNDLNTTAVGAQQTPPGESLAPSTPRLGRARVRLQRIVWDSRVMCIAARIVPASDQDEAAEFQTVNECAHVTIGTADASIKPRESNDLLARWMKEGAGGEGGNGIYELDTSGGRWNEESGQWDGDGHAREGSEIWGEVRGVLQKH